MKKLYVLLILFLFVGCNSKPKEIEKVKVNTNETIMNIETINEFELQPISLIYEKGLSTLSLKIKNLSATRTINKIKVEFYLKNGNLFTEIIDETTYEIKENSSIYLALRSDLDLTNIEKVKYTLE